MTDTAFEFDLESLSLRYGAAHCDWEDRCPCDCGECTVRCQQPSRFAVARSDRDPSYDAAPDRAPTEACEAHLSGTLMLLMGGEETACAVVKPRWDQSRLCQICRTPIHRIDCPTGGWWAHEAHPADSHDAQLFPCDDNIPCSGCGGEHRDAP